MESRGEELLTAVTKIFLILGDILFGAELSGGRGTERECCG